MTILSELEALVQEWSRRVILQAIWFVDCPGERYRLERTLREYVPELFEQRTALPVPGPHIAGVPVREWWSASATADEWRRWPWIVLWPGVWLQYSDGVFARWRSS